MTSTVYRFYDNLTRKKTYATDELHVSELKRCLTVFDLTILGIGSTLGTGTYILTGQVAHETAGPSVILSFLIAAIASVLAGLCYAEFGARAPRAGSAYTYTYVSVGEIMAFIIGWNMILEYVIGAASTSRALSGYFDSLIGFQMKTFFIKYLPLHAGTFAEYADLFAMSLCLLVTVLLVIGIKESALLNNVFTGINLIVIAIVVIAGLTKAHLHNWDISPAEIKNITNTTETIGSGGFFPFGIEGTLAGAATCFYAFVGFDLVATTGEETKNPQRAIPMSICFTLLVCSIVYCSVSIVITLMVPYYLINPDAVLPEAFQYVNLSALKYVVGVGALTGIFTSLLGTLLPLPRVLYAIASDGLIFRFIAWIHPRLQTPMIATILGGIVSAIMALIFDLKKLVEMMSIGTLLAYSLVSISVLFLRYQPVDDPLLPNDELASLSVYRQLFKPSGRRPTFSSAKLTKYLITCLTINGCILCAIQIFAGHHIANKNPTAIIVLIIFLITEILFIIAIAAQPKNQKSIYFQTPCVPYVPILSILINTYLILKLSPATWIRFGVWMFLGFLIYGFYGFWHSSQRFINDTQRLLSGSTSSFNDS
ncbi:unnamed protein product [Rotaria magnacalcarata]|uniref:Cationic amino acid transporter C-terminal domain-containing protein n=1 Tax=Rotaria magnacalcarata TaxID=392030 RepID=A0A819JTB1_9BILA|nr:unnamed protein product [Rotaria magnacalcarata]CAF2220895.1 unnamed protein product [Rotaria magnacalcarata]CAF3854759.1 unnamed protein product [Rotaria magnacalcarata]CAF3937999.1 unnamed protein product [Rotaria magnacalcarata]